MGDRQTAYDQLIRLADTQGYVTFDNIMNCADEHSLSIQDFDWLSNSITTRGILVYSEAPAHQVPTDDEFDDFAQSDYGSVYDRIIELSPPLEMFITYVKSIIPPQRGEIRQLKYQVIEGNSHARERMIEMHLRLALRMALQRAVAYDMDIEDAVGYACAGLIVAVDKYDPDRPGAFASYAAAWIWQNISRKQSTQRPLVYYPAHKKNDYFSVYPLLKGYGCVECDNIQNCVKAMEMVCEKIGCSEVEAKKILEQMIPDSLIEDLSRRYTDWTEELSPEDISVGTLLGYLSSKTIASEEDFFLNLYNRMLAEDVKLALSTLAPREKSILLLRCGFEGHEHTLAEIGDKFNLTRERIRQIEAKALNKLRNSLHSKRLEDYL